jgi:hypothetical protein
VVPVPLTAEMRAAYWHGIRIIGFFAQLCKPYFKSASLRFSSSRGDACRLYIGYSKHRKISTYRPKCHFFNKFMRASIDFDYFRYARWRRWPPGRRRGGSVNFGGEAIAANSPAPVHSRRQQPYLSRRADGLAKVLHFRSVELAQSQNVPSVLKQLGGAEHSTQVMREVMGMESGKVLAVNSMDRIEHVEIDSANLNQGFEKFAQHLKQSGLSWPQLLASAFTLDTLLRSLERSKDLRVRL